jgi:hypothetical protein
MALLTYAGLGESCASSAEKLARRCSYNGFRPVCTEKHPGMIVALVGHGGIMKRTQNIAITILGIFLFGAIFFSVSPAQSEVQPSDPAAYYKAKCIACHGPKADKKFDASLTDEQLLEAILKGKKPEKPPNMPAYGEKGVTADQAKGLLDHMKQLRAAQ